MLKNLLPMAALTLGLAIAPLRASDWDHRTEISIDQPINVQGTVLEAGQYVMKVLEQTDDSTVVMIFDRGEKHLITTVVGMPTYRMEPTSDSAFAFYQKSAEQPAALKSWFYPGQYFGLEFRDAPVSDVSDR